MCMRFVSVESMYVCVGGCIFYGCVAVTIMCSYLNVLNTIHLVNLSWLVWFRLSTELKLDNLTLS